ncbi:OmpA/MotB domain-containing protein [Candidatus Protofrankia californiensis]|uniref:OmpA/MotB domain-containing protein n=1 Tax=Candidatus Protofrankia californiensis TaxID=1839754 RepID=A0A1C3PH05_9ACTN|nr:OmpA/MotB domain-containing protein [Candidatus Protofrankia californiensis]
MIPVRTLTRGVTVRPGPAPNGFGWAVLALVVAAVSWVCVPTARAATEAPVASPTVTDQSIIESIRDIDPAAAIRPIDVEQAVVALRTERHDGSGVAVTISSDVLFAFDSADLTEVARGQLADIAAQIGKATGTLGVNGYTDSTGTPAYNVILSQRRANAVADLLRPKAPPGVLVSATGRGAGNPIAPNTNPDGSDNSAGRGQNRRVSITYRTS